MKDIAKFAISLAVPEPEPETVPPPFPVLPPGVTVLSFLSESRSART